MLDRKIKDSDASIELLEDRAKNNKIFLFIFFIGGWVTAASGFFLMPLKYTTPVMNLGICLLIFATWYLMFMLYYVILIKIEKKMENK